MKRLITGCWVFVVLLLCVRGEEPAGEIGGALFIHGGGALTKPLMDAFLDLCDRPVAKLVIIPTAAEDGQIDQAKILAAWKGRGFAGVDVLHTRSREVANSEEFVSVLSNASAVWIGGGQQSRLEASYVGTLVEEELKALVARGGVVGGSSAGAAVMSEVMIRSGDEVAEVGRGFGLIEGAVIDQHFVVRKREKRLVGVLAEREGLVGYGVDEGTAMIWQGRRLSMVGVSTVTVCLAASDEREAVVAARVVPWQADAVALSRAALARKANLKFEAKELDVPKGTVMAFGGGGTTKGGLQRFVDRAGGVNGRIVIISTASEEVPKMPKHWRRMWDSVGAKNLVVMDAATREVANSDEFVKEIDAAGGVWFTGGRQWHLVDRYLGTKSEAAFKRVLERGGVVGGTSAGASFLGEYLARGNPLNSLALMQEGYEEGLGLVPGVAIDQHFSQRARFDDMEGFRRVYPQLMGIGIDEVTAVAFEENRCQVFGQGKVYLYLLDGKREELGHFQRYKF